MQEPEEESYSKFRIEELKYRNRQFQQKQQWQTLTWIIVGTVLLLALYIINQFLTRVTTNYPNKISVRVDTLTIKSSTDTLRIVPKAVQRKTNDP